MTSTPTPTPTSTSTPTSISAPTSIPAPIPACLELATFRARAGITPAEVGLALAGAQAWLLAQPGFLSRRLLRDEAEDLWIDEVAWRSAEDAARAMAAYPTSPIAAGLDRVVDPASFRCLHAAPVPLDAAP